MNRKIGAIGSLINALTVLGFAVFLMAGWNFGYFLICIFLSMSFICMIAAFYTECPNEKKTAGVVAIMFTVIYAVLIIIVYYTQCTTVVNEQLGHDADQILNYSNMGLIFNLDILGYGIMALATFFIGLTINVRDKKDKALKVLFLLHGAFFPGCFFMPMTGMFLKSGGSTSSGSGGVIALEVWCLYFLPIGILSYLHFKKSANIKPQT